MILPYIEPLVVRELGDRVVPEPPRRGEPGGDPCGICTGEATGGVWSDDHWTLHPPVGGSLLGAVWLASRVHVDSFSDLPEEFAADFGGVAAGWSERSSASATSPASTCIGGVTAGRTSTCGSCRGRSACSRRRG